MFTLKENKGVLSHANATHTKGQHSAEHDTFTRAQLEKQKQKTKLKKSRDSAPLQR